MALSLPLPRSAVERFASLTVRDFPEEVKTSLGAVGFGGSRAGEGAGIGEGGRDTIGAGDGVSIVRSTLILGESVPSGEGESIPVDWMRTRGYRDQSKHLRRWWW